MNNSAAKVGEIFREAGTAFTKLSEMTLMLQPTDDATPGSKWSEEDVEMLRGCVNRFAVELNKISQHIKNRTMSYLRRLLELDTGNIYDVSRSPTHISQVLQITPPALEPQIVGILLEQHHLTIQTHQQELSSPQACQLRYPNLQTHEQQQFGNPQGWQEHAIHYPHPHQQAAPAAEFPNRQPYQQELGWPLPLQLEQPISTSYPYQQERGRPLPWQDRLYLHPHQQEFGSPQLMHQNNNISQLRQPLHANPQPLIFPPVETEHSFAWEPEPVNPQINKTRKLPTITLQKTTQLEVFFPEDNDVADLRHFNPGIVPLTPPANIMQDDILPSSNIMQEDIPRPLNIMQEVNPFPANIIQEDIPRQVNIIQEVNPFPANIIQEDIPRQVNIMQEVNPFPANLIQEDIPRPAEFDDTEDSEVAQTCAVVTELMPVLDQEFSRFVIFPSYSSFRNFPVEGNNIVNTVNGRLMLTVKSKHYFWSIPTRNWELNKQQAITGTTTDNTDNQEIEDLPQPEVSFPNSRSGESAGDIQPVEENSLSILSTDDETIYITNQDTPQLHSDPIPGAFSSIFIQNNSPFSTSYNSVGYAESELKPHLCKPFSTDPFNSMTSNHFLNDNSCSDTPAQSNVLQWDDQFFQFSNMERTPKQNPETVEDEEIGPFSSLFARKDQNEETELEQKSNSSSNPSVEAMSETTGNVRSKQTQNNEKALPSSSQRTRGSRGRGNTRRRGARGRCVARASADMTQADDTEKPIPKRRKKATIGTKSGPVTRAQAKNIYR